MVLKALGLDFAEQNSSGPGRPPEGVLDEIDTARRETACKAGRVHGIAPSNRLLFLWLQSLLWSRRDREAQ